MLTNLNIGIAAGLITGLLYWLTYKWPALHRSKTKAIRLLHPVLNLALMIGCGHALVTLLLALKLQGAPATRQNAILAWLYISAAIAVIALIRHYKEIPKPKE